MRIPADLQNLHELLQYVRARSLEAGLSQLEAKRVELACEEIVVNIISYAYAEGSGSVELAFRSSLPGQVKIEIVDEGPKFDPLTVPADIDLDLPLHDRPEGGLGLFLVRQIVDSLSYRREGNRNIVTLTKKGHQE